MKPALGTLIAYLDASDDVVVTDLWTFVLEGGAAPLRYVDYPLPSLTIPSLNFPGSPQNYVASGESFQTFNRGPRFGRSKVSTKIGLEPAELNVDVYASSADNIGGQNGLTWQQFADVGGFDGAIIELDRFFMPVGYDGIAGPLNTTLGAIVWFYGKVADVEITRSAVKIKVKSLINLLQQQQMPRRIFQSGCTHIFGDAMCGYDRTNGRNAAGVPTGVGYGSIGASAGSTQYQIITGPGVPLYYAQGSALCISGNNVGITRGISSVVPGAASTLILTKPFPFPDVAGQNFNLLPGCDHTAATCVNVFNNLARYGGFDYIPPPELAI